MRALWEPLWPWPHQGFDRRLPEPRSERPCLSLAKAQTGVAAVELTEFGTSEKTLTASTCLWHADF